jgi:hypothetical protein
MRKRTAEMINDLAFVCKEIRKGQDLNVVDRVESPSWHMNLKVCQPLTDLRDSFQDTKAHA